jgi:peroxiredoxin
MKKLLYLMLVVFVLASCTLDDKTMHYTLKVELDTLVDGYAYLQKRQDGKWVKIDSALMEENSFHMQGTLDFPQVYYLSIKDLKRNIFLFMDEGDITVDLKKADPRTTGVEGSAAHDLYLEFKDQTDGFEDRLRSIYQQYRIAEDSGNTVLQDSLSVIMDEVYDEQQAFIMEYLYNNNDLVTAPYIAYSNSYSWTVDELDSIVGNFSGSLAPSPEYALLKERVVTLKRVDIGQPLVDFTMKDTSDVDVKLSEVSKGKYMLVDFWAAWCGPCRAENPNIVACYNDFKDKGFDVLGVSFDQDRDRWIQAIHDDGLSWNHISELNGWNNTAAKLYGIRSIPSSVLLDPDGIIIAKNLRGEDLRNKLEELMP